MAADHALTDRLDELIALFNRRSMDLPDGLFDRRTQFLLNGTPFEELLGQPSGDPLVLMIARGPAGYRFAAKALQHAVPDARVERGNLASPTGSAESDWSVDLWLSGHERGSGAPVETVMRARVSGGRNTAVSRADLQVDERVASRLRAARLLD